MRDVCLRACARLTIDRPRTIVALALLLSVLAATYASFRLEVNANTDDLIAAERPYMQSYLAFIEDFGDLEAIYAVVDAKGDSSLGEECVQALAARLRAIEGLPAVHAEISPAEQRRTALRSMTDEELEELHLARDAYPLLFSDGGTAALLTDSTQRLNRLMLTGALTSDARRRRSGASAILALELLRKVAGQNPEGAPSSAPRFESNYLCSPSGRLYFIEIMPAKDYGTLAVIEEPLTAIRDAIEATRREFTEIEIGLTGKPVLQADEMRTSDADMMRASIMAIVLVAALFMVVLGGFWRPALAVLALLMAIAWTFGLTTLVVGQLNLLSIVFTLILVGVGIDFGVHILTRYQEELSDAPPEEAMVAALITSGRGNATGAMTSSLAFLMAMLTDFQGLRELGFVAGTGLLLCLVAMTTVLPALVLLRDRKGPGLARTKTPSLPWFRLPKVAMQRPGLWLGSIAILTVATLPFGSRVGFDGNVLELQAVGLESVDWEHRILEDSSSASWFGAALADDLAEVDALIERAQAESEVIGEVRSIRSLVRRETPERRTRVDELISTLDSATEVTRRDWTVDHLERACGALGRLAKLATDREPKEAEPLQDLHRELSETVERLKNLAEAERMSAMATIDRELDRSARELKEILEGGRRDLRESLPEALRDRYMSRSGRFLVSLHPRENVWDEGEMSTFVAAMRRVAPDVTGVPITHSESIEDMRGGFLKAALLALAAVMVIVLIDFRGIRDGLLALIPLVTGGIWLVQLMGMLGLQFNLANFFSVPILIGIGVDDGIHLVHRFREGGADRNEFSSTHRGVLLTTMTSLIGFGCLATASHRGLQSLGLVMFLGCATCLIASLMVLPPLLRLLDRRRESGADALV